MQNLPPSDAALDARLRLIVESYRRLTGKPLLGNISFPPPCRGRVREGVESLGNTVSTPTPALMEQLAIRLSPQAGKSLVIPLVGGGSDEVMVLRDALWNAPFAIVAHGTEADPVFFYGNEYALNCFEMDFDEFTCLPSRFSAEVVAQESREKALRKVAEQGYIDGYSGMRIASSGRCFMITECTIWNLADAAGGYGGQAAIFVVAD